MNGISELILKCLKKIYQWIFHRKSSTYVMPEDIGLSAEQVSDIIYEKLSSDKPCMIARYGSTELLAIQNCLAVESPNYSIWKYIQGKQSQWWWMDSAIKQLEMCAGFFPSNKETVSRFTKLMVEDSALVDVLALWTGSEKRMPLSQNCEYIHLLMLEPYWSSHPWTRALKNKKIVIVHPFAELIEKQYAQKRQHLFENKDVLPEFQLRTVKAVQSLGGDSNGFKDWFEALHWMENEIDKEDYDICLIGCGAYGFPLAAHCKRNGKKAVHLGGALQLLFGIKGKRWEKEDYCKNWHMEPHDFYIKMMSNENWCRPSDFKVKNSDNVENSCYW